MCDISRINVEGNRNLTKLQKLYDWPVTLTNTINNELLQH